MTLIEILAVTGWVFVLFLLIDRHYMEKDFKAAVVCGEDAIRLAENMASGKKVSKEHYERAMTTFNSVRFGDVDMSSDSDGNIRISGNRPTIIRNDKGELVAVTRKNKCW